MAILMRSKLCSSDYHLRLRARDPEASCQLQKVRGRLDPLHSAQEQRRARIHQRKRHHPISQRRGQQVHQLLQVLGVIGHL